MPSPQVVEVIHSLMLSKYVVISLHAVHSVVSGPEQSLHSVSQAKESYYVSASTLLVRGRGRRYLSKCVFQLPILRNTRLHNLTGISRLPWLRLQGNNRYPRRACKLQHSTRRRIPNSLPGKLRNELVLGSFLRSHSVSAAFSTVLGLAEQSDAHSC